MVIALVGALIVVAGCSSGGSATATATASTTAAASAAASQAAPGAGTGTLPGDLCTLVTAADVTQIYGGSVSPAPPSEDNSCDYEISGQALAGTSAAAGEFAIADNGDWSSYDDAKVVFGDAVKKIDGLGTEAFSYGGFIHAKVGSSDLTVGGVFVGDYDRAKLDQETFDMAKLVLSRV
jgi:hypothetical protein